MDATLNLVISLETIKELGSYLWIPFVAAFTWIWRRINRGIKDAKDRAEAALPRTEFQGYATRMEQVRLEQREELKDYRTDIKDFVVKLDQHFREDAANFRSTMQALNDQTRTLVDKIEGKQDKGRGVA